MQTLIEKGDKKQVKKGEYNLSFLHKSAAYLQGI